MKINKDSWHYDLASFGSDRVKFHNDRFYRLDLCLYVRALLKGVAISVMLFTLVTLVSWCVVDFCLWIVVSLLNTWFEPDLGAVVCMLVLGIGAVALFLKGIYVGATRTLSIDPVQEAYRGWKNKYCPTITLD